ncbi:MAG TPA: hypothetical protein PKY35_12415 [Candidatus Hydrogenedentes bacterium]|nr:hypothetical protein [Candidatus Hydrogenedentota bacterium]HOL77822.1 hypothetical protein [Candidatus Hydrogenedentota bacterium]HPO86884.1 hypothetical protein [Candidatus Hydrogenedentota bacterium]
MKRAILVIVMISCSLFGSYADGVFKQMNVVTGKDAGPVEQRAAKLLCDRVTELSGATVRVSSEDNLQDTLHDSCVVLLGVPAHHAQLAALFQKYQIPNLTWLEPGLEGFLLKTLKDSSRRTVLAAGVDERGCLYAVGELLRHVEEREPDGFSIPDDLDIRTAPAYEWRGTQVGQSATQLEKAHTRIRTPEELERTMLDYVLAGANTFDVTTVEEVELLDSWGMKKRICRSGNGGQFPDHPEWAAKESIGRSGFVCLSIPEARQAVIQECDRFFRDFPFVDTVHFSGGDGGGCECDACDPYGRVFIETVAEMARRVLKYHPRTKIVFTNQKFDNADDAAILAYLQSQPHDWLYAWCMSPGGDATSWQPGHRQTHRMDLFRYPGYGPYALYPRTLLHALPGDVELMCGSEITHWRYAQHAYVQKYPRPDKNGDQPPHWSHEIYERRPDRYLTQIYDRRTFYAWPTYYYRVFGDLMHYAVGDVTHSSGLHDHFNQWMWMRLLWNPRQSVEEVVNDYCVTFFGREAAQDMAEAIFLMEKYLQDEPKRPLPQKTELDRYVACCREAGRKMSARRKEKSWLWRVFLQKGLVDKWVQLAVIEQERMQSDVETIIREALEGGTDLDQAIARARARMEVPWKTEEMQNLYAEAAQLGEESNSLFAFRNDGLFSLERDYIGLGWLRRQLERAASAQDEQEKRDLLHMIPFYEDPGEGGFYDNLGTYNHCPHVVWGYPYDHGQPYLEEMLDSGNRYSQKEMHCTQDEAQGITLHYSGLDPRVSYRVRFTLVRPWFQERYAARMVQKTESIYADAVLLAKDLELPYRMSDFFTFDIPRSCTEDGELTIRFEKAAGVGEWDRVTTEQWRNTGGWGTLCSEVWLMKKEDSVGRVP